MSNVVRMKSWTIQSFSSYTQATLAWSKSTESQERPATETWCIPSLIALSSYCSLNNNKHGKTTCSDHLFKSNLAMVSLWAKPDCLREMLIFFFSSQICRQQDVRDKVMTRELWGYHGVSVLLEFVWGNRPLVLQKQVLQETLYIPKDNNAIMKSGTTIPIISLCYCKLHIYCKGSSM